MTRILRILFVVAMCGVAGALAAPAAAQDGPTEAEDTLAGESVEDADVVYQREVFAYDGTGRRDPFRSLLDAAELGVRLDDLVPVGVVFDQAGQSVVMLRERGTDRRFRLREGDQIGTIRVISIQPDRVVVRETVMGETRDQTLRIRQRDR